MVSDFELLKRVRARLQDEHAAAVRLGDLERGAAVLGALEFVCWLLYHAAAHRGAWERLQKLLSGDLSLDVAEYRCPKCHKFYKRFQPLRGHRHPEENKIWCFDCARSRNGVRA